MQCDFALVIDDDSGIERQDRPRGLRLHDGKYPPDIRLPARLPVLTDLRTVQTQQHLVIRPDGRIQARPSELFRKNDQIKTRITGLGRRDGLADSVNVHLNIPGLLRLQQDTNRWQPAMPLPSQLTEPVLPI